MSDARRTASELAGRGFKVLPVDANKRPLLKDWTNKATDDPSMVNRLWTQFYKGAGVGILTGRRGGIVVIDVDNKDGHARERLQGLIKEGWPKTWVTKTRSGGFHLYYLAWDEPVKTRAGWRDQIDIRADGGQVVAYGMPEWTEISGLTAPWREKLQGPATKPSTYDVRRTTNEDMDVGYYESFELPQVIPSGERNDTLYRYACSLYGRGETPKSVRAKVLAAAEDRCVPPYSKEETDLLLGSATDWYVKVERAGDAEDEGGGSEDHNLLDARGEDDPLVALQSRFAFVAQDNVVFDLAMRKFLPLEGFKNANRPPYETRPKAKRKGPAPTLATAWLNHPDTLRTPYVDYAPDNPQVFERGGDNILNLWVPPALEPKKGDVRPFMEHLEFLFDGDRASAKHFLHWLAYVVQNPGKRVGHACLIVGGQGTGKSVIATVLRRMLGDHNVCLVSNSILQSGYNEWMEHTQIAVAEEFRMSGRWNMMNELKALVSEEKIVINAKYRRPYNCDNHTNFLLFSNFDDAAHLEGDDRRYWVFVSKAKKRSHDYYTALWEWARGEGPGALLYALKKLDLTAFEKSRWNPPATKSKQAMIDASRSDVEAWLDTALEDGTYPLAADVVTESNLKQAIAAEHSPQDKVWARRWLRKHGHALPVTRGKDGKAVRLWAVRNATKWEAAPGPERVAEYEKGMSFA